MKGWGEQVKFYPYRKDRGGIFSHGEEGGGGGAQHVLRYF